MSKAFREVDPLLLYKVHCRYAFYLSIPPPLGGHGPFLDGKGGLTVLQATWIYQADTVEPSDCSGIDVGKKTRRGDATYLAKVCPQCLTSKKSGRRSFSHEQALSNADDVAPQRLHQQAVHRSNKPALRASPYMLTSFGKDCLYRPVVSLLT
ncbi:uncharacterized protein PV09_06061 [Verruconis gallopava]|uniref:Uncharacterized protein n=1 Tax=Verruconis gallopava TaxID=253628 RepID=A0A0D2AU12_9PEZI|nr:uncharacterized protein PV09_06061 [Verruconis gallopava]KIW02614.1 hypothetical protein PV09_06061 [Verruconis gallopava]